jgi:DnaJ homolog subfamily A member 2
LTLSESLTGFSRIVLTHLDGRGITLTVPRGKVVNHGDTLKISGEGMWQEGARRKGDLWVRCELEKIGEDWLKSVDLEVGLGLLPRRQQNEN